MLNTNISYFDNAKVTTGTEKTIKEIIIIIQNEIYKDKILNIRKEADKKKRNQLKENLPCITVSGLFAGGRKQENITAHSGLMQIDFDNVPDLKETHKTLQNDKYTFVLFISPSGTGLKLFVKIPASTQEHKRSFEVVEQYYKKNYNLQIDINTKDINRLCYLSADKNLFLNENAKAFEISELPQEQNLLSVQSANTSQNHNTNQHTTPKHTKKNYIDFTHQDKRAEVERILNLINFDITQNFNDWLKIGFAFADEFGENGRDYFHKISSYYPNYDHEEVNLQYTNCLLKNNGQTRINTFFEIAKNHNINISLPKNTHHNTTPQETTTTQPATENDQPTTEKDKKIQELKNDFARIGTEYFLLRKNKPPQKWEKILILDDYAKHFDLKKDNVLCHIPKYDEGFCLSPDNINYQRIINNKYNLYEPLSHEPKEGNTQKTHDFLKHIFQNYYEIGLDYLTILYQNPKQSLPILCLVSEDRSTGKTTFLNFLNMLFEQNAVCLNLSDFEDNYNAHYISKLLICLDEGIISQKSIEKIKNHTTSQKQQQKAKFLNNEQIDNFGKILICSNEVHNFVKIDKKENRFFVNIVPKFIKENPNLLQELAKEKNAFVFELQNRQITHPKKTRFWFDYHLYETEATKKIKENSKTDLEQLFKIYVDNICELAETTEFYKTAKQILFDFCEHYNEKKITVVDITNFLQNEKKLFPPKNTQRRNIYIFKELEKAEKIMQTDTETGEETVKFDSKVFISQIGRFYTLKKEDF